MFRTWLVVGLTAFGLSGCAFWLDKAPVGERAPEIYSGASDYQIGPGDSLQIFVWRNAELSVIVPVRPDGRFSIPLLQEIPAAGKTPSQVADEIKHGLSAFVRDPIVTVIVLTAQGAGQGKVSLIGEATTPKSVPYRAGLTLLDVMIDVGGLTEFANGNDARLVRVTDGKPKEFRVRVADLMKDGDTTANIELVPGDVIRIPERWF